MPACDGAVADHAVTNATLALTVEEEDPFVEHLLSGLTAYPTYYAHMGPINRAGPAPLDLTRPAVVDPEDLRNRIRAGAWVVDLGHRRVFAAGHIPGTVSFELGNSFATHVGWIVSWGVPITFVGDSPDQVDAAQRALARIGFDRVAGAATRPRELLVWSSPPTSSPAASRWRPTPWPTSPSWRMRCETAIL